jgi:FkbM family methyltransferase
MLQSAIQNSVKLVPWRLRGAIRHIPGIAALQRFVLREFLHGREFVHFIESGPATGLHYPVLLPDDKGVWTGNYEVEFVSALVNAVQPGDVCYDIGGWRGYCGGAMAAHHAKRVFIFEPLPENCERIEKLIQLNSQLPIELVRSAVGEAHGTAEFSMLDATSMGKLSNSPFQPEVQSCQQLTVNVVAIDAWRRENKAELPQVIKIDVEGAEYMVLRGAEKTIKESLPRLFIECHSRQLTEQVSHFVQNLGYTCKTLETGHAPDGHSEPEVCHLMATCNN